MSSIGVISRAKGVVQSKDIRALVSLKFIFSSLYRDSELSILMIVQVSAALVNDLNCYSPELVEV